VADCVPAVEAGKLVYFLEYHCHKKYETEQKIR